MIYEIFQYINNHFLVFNGIVLASMASSLIYLLTKRKYDKAIGIGLAMSALITLNLLRH
jgi:hypothetical protein